MLPILILTTVALSSSDVLPILFNKDYTQSYNIDNHDDDTFSNRHPHRDTNMYYNKIPSQDYLAVPIKEINAIYPDNNNQDVKDVSDNTNKEQNYDDEGFRKEQWHNYPRQLDRLHNYKEVRADEVKSANPESINDFDDLTTDQIIFDTGDGNRNIYDTIVAANNPFLILKVQLSYLRDNKDMSEYPSFPTNFEDNEERKDNDYTKAVSSVIEPVANVVKVKREKPIRNHDNEVSEGELFGTENGKSIH